MELRFVQALVPLNPNGVAVSGTCDACKEADVHTQAIAIWQDETNRGYALCQKHADQMEAKVIPGCSYAPTNLPLPGFMYRNGGYIADPTWQPRRPPK